MNDLKRLVYGIIEKEDLPETPATTNTSLILRNQYPPQTSELLKHSAVPVNTKQAEDQIQDTEAFIEESFSIEEKEKELIKKHWKKPRKAQTGSQRPGYIRTYTLPKVKRIRHRKFLKLILLYLSE